MRGSGEEPGNLAEWNSPTGWRSSYDDLADGLYFFAEDIFGVQFAIDGDAIITFDPETGDRVRVAASFEEWAGKILDEYDIFTGWPMAALWQQERGAIPRGMRLVPRQPFVAEGGFDLSNLRLMDDAEGMRERAAFALRIRDIPDGGSAEWNVPQQ